MRIVLADDAALMREGLSGLLTRMGHDVVALAASATELETVVDSLADDLPDILVTDVRMPPTMTDDGLKAVIRLRERYPNLAVLMLSQYVAPAYASELFARGGSAGLGYLLKDRVSRVADFMASLTVVAQGGMVVDPEVAARFVKGGPSVVHDLTERELEVLELMAQGLSNTQIEGKLFLSRAAVARHVASVFLKFGLDPSEDNRRVRVVLAYLSDNPLSR